MSFEYFEAESHVSTYNKFRPSPPENLIEKIVRFTTEKIPEPLEWAIDVGCGSGQSTEVLANYFKKVLGLDSSDQIIREARKKCLHLNVFYSTCPGERMDVGDKSADLVTVGQALHWFNIPKFYSEAERVLKSKGVLAVYGYELPVPVCEGCKEIEMLVGKYYNDILVEYTLPQSRKVYLDKYTSEEFNKINFVEGKQMQRFENFILEMEGTINDIAGYITSWSAFQNYTKQMGEESGKQLVQKFKKEFKFLSGYDAADKFKIRFNYFLLLGRKE